MECKVKNYKYQKKKIRTNVPKFEKTIRTLRLSQNDLVLIKKSVKTKVGLNLEKDMRFKFSFS